MSETSDQKWVHRVQACWDAEQADYRTNYREHSIAQGYPDMYLDSDRPTAQECLAALARVRRSTSTTHPTDVAAYLAREQVLAEERLRVVISKPDPKWHQRARTHPDEFHVASYVGHFRLAKTPNGWLLTNTRDETQTYGPFSTKAAVVTHLQEQTAVQAAADTARAEREASAQRERGRRLVEQYDADPSGFVAELVRDHRAG